MDDKDKSGAATQASIPAGWTQIVFDDFPEFNEHAMGCGLEDRGITDRYEAMRYGFEEALDLVDERIKLFLDDIAPAAPTSQAEPVVAGQQVAVPADQVVHGIPYETTYADLARLTPEQLWNRWVPHGRSVNAREAFIAARKIPQVVTYAAPSSLPMAADARDQVLEEAARACDELSLDAQDCYSDNQDQYNDTLIKCATTIRALKIDGKGVGR